MSSPQVSNQFVPAGSFYVRSDQVDEVQQVYRDNPEAVRSIPARAYITGVNRYGGVNYTMTAPEGSHVANPTALTNLATVASQPATEQQAVEQGYTSYIPQNQKETYYGQVRQQVDAEQSYTQRVSQSEAAASRMGLPKELGTQFDLVQAEQCIPVGQHPTGEYQIVEMSGPLKPDQERPKALLIKTEEADVPQNVSVIGASDNPELDTAKYMQLKYEHSQIQRVSAGTSAPKLGVEQQIGEVESISANLSPENKTAFENWQMSRKGDFAKNVALTSTAVIAAPILGVGGVATSILVGTGLTQGFKTASEVAAGQPITSLTTQELFEGVTTSIIFAGTAKFLIGAVESHAAVRGLSRATDSGVKITPIGEVGVNAAVGAGGSAVLSGGDPVRTAEGAGFAVGLGIAGRGVSGLANRVLGVKVTEVSKVREATRTESMGDTRSTTGIVEVQTKQTRVPLNEVNKALLIKDRQFDLAGTEKTTVIRKDVSGVPEQVTTEGKIVTATKNAEPILNMLEGKQFKTSTSKLTNVNTVKGVTPDVLASEKVTVESGLGRVSTREGPVKNPALLITKKVVAVKDVFPTENKVTIREYDTIRMRGKVNDDLAVVERATNNMQGFGGKSSTPVVRAIGGKESTGMKPGTNKFFRETSEQPKVSKVNSDNAKAVTEVTSNKQVDSTVNVKAETSRAIISADLDSNILRISGVPMNKPVTYELYEEQAVSYPVKNEVVKSIIGMELDKPLSERVSISYDIPIRKVSAPNLDVGDATKNPNVPAFNKPAYTPVITPDQPQPITYVNTPSTNPIITPIVTQAITPIVTPSITPVEDVVITPPPTNPQRIIPDMPKIFNPLGDQYSGRPVYLNRRGKRRQLYELGTTEYPVVTAGEILRGTKKRRK